MLRFRAILAALGLVLCAAPLVAQDARPADPRRDSLEARVRQRMAQMLRTEVGLSDEQIRRLQATNRRFEGQRRELFNEERRVRGELRLAIEQGDSAQQGRIGPLLDRTIQLQRQRLDLLEAEQKELAEFLTPLQRAKLYGLEEQMRRRMQEMRDSGPTRRMMVQPGTRPPTTRRPPEGS